MKHIAIPLAALLIAGCGATTQVATRQAGPYDNMGLARKAACYGCLKPQNDAEAGFLRSIRDTINQLLGEGK